MEGARRLSSEALLAHTNSIDAALSAGYKAMAGSPQQRPVTPELLGRSSFSSVREHDADLAQTFTLSKTSSYHRLSEHAVDDSPMAAAALAATNLHGRLHGRWDGEAAFARRHGQMAAVSSRLAGKRDAEWKSDSRWVEPDEMELDAAPPAPSPLEALPVEVFDLIVEYLTLDTPPNGVDRRNVDLISLLSTSRAVNANTMETLYRRVTIPHSNIFRKFLDQISDTPQRGEWVRRLDFSHFNPATLFSTEAERAEARNLTSDTLLRCLALTPNLQEFLVQEYIEDDLSPAVLRKLLLALPRLQALDFCGCSSLAFRDAFSSAVADADAWPPALGLKRLSFHKCRTLPSSIFAALLPRLHHLTHLDVAGTRVTDDALASIPRDARITHLNLATCRLLSFDATIAFLERHPAVNRSLEVLSVATDSRTQESLDADDVARLVAALPPTLRSLSLKGSKMDPRTLHALLPLTKHLEELALGRGLRLSDLHVLFAPDPASPASHQRAWVPSALKYIDLTDMTAADVSGGLLADGLLLTPRSAPLEVVELSEDVFKQVAKATAPLARLGWRTSEVHSRAWLVRNPPADRPRRDDGRRPWKMGAHFWGMRKVPVANAEVGGMYGSFMFGRKL